MDHPYYTVTVENLTRGWSYTITEGDDADPADPVQLGTPLTYVWGFENETVPAQLVPCQASVLLWSRSAGDVPIVDTGDQVTIDVRVGTTGPRIIAPPPMRVTAVDMAVGEGIVRDGYAVQTVIQVVDVTAELRSMFVQPTPSSAWGMSNTPFARERWRVRLAQIEYAMSRTIGAPTWWDDDERPPDLTGAGSFVSGLADYGSWTSDVKTLLEELLNSHQPDNLTHVVTPGWSDDPSAFPTGWEHVGPTTYWGQLVDNTDAATEIFTEPLTSSRYYMMPASRRTDSTDLPLSLDVVDGVLTLVPNFAGDTFLTAVDAEWCNLPAQLRRARGNAINTLHVSGQETFVRVRATGGSDKRDSTRDFVDSTAATLDGPIARQVSTQLDFGETADSAGGPLLTWTAGPDIASNYLSDATQRATWVHDAFTVVSSRIPQDIAEDLLPQLAPRFVNEPDGDEEVLRHMTIYRADTKSLPADLTTSVNGFVVTGQLTITGGDIAWGFTLTPGAPQWTAGAPTPVTFAEMEAIATANGLTADDIDPHITFGDLAFVDS